MQKVRYINLERGFPTVDLAVGYGGTAGHL